MKKLYLFIVIAVFLLGFILRFYHLSDLPNGLNQDETAIDYNAYAILLTGKDEYGHVLPLYFKSFGDYKLPVYIYLTVVAIKMFGLTAFAVRFWSALLGSLTIPLVYLLTKLLTQREKRLGISQNDKDTMSHLQQNHLISFHFTHYDNMLPLVTSVLLAINPWHLFFSRVAFEVNVANFFLTLGVLLFLLGIQKKKLFWYVLSLISFGICLYTYNVTRLVAPVLFLFLVSYFKDTMVKISLWGKILLPILFILFLLPFAVTFVSGSGFSSQTTVLIFGGTEKASMINFRAFLLVLPSLFTRLVFNNYFLIIWSYLRNIIGFFSTTFFFLSGGSFSVSVGNVGMFYLFEAPTLLFGFYLAFKGTYSYLRFCSIWFLLILFIIGISTNAPHATRDFTMIVPLVVLSAAGLLEMWQQMRKWRSIFLQRIAVIIYCGLIVYSLLYFAVSYVYRFPILGAQTWRPVDKALALYLQQQEGKYDHIVIDSDADFVYTSLLFYQQVSPQIFLADSVHQKDSLFIGIDSFGKYTYRHIDWAKDLSSPKTLFVTATNNMLSTRTPDKIFTSPTRPIVLYDNKTYAEYSKSDVAYALYIGGEK